MATQAGYSRFGRSELTTMYGISAARVPPPNKCIHVRKTRLLAGANTDCAAEQSMP